MSALNEDKLDRAVYVRINLALVQEEALKLHARLRDNTSFIYWSLDMYSSKQ